MYYSFAKHSGIYVWQVPFKIPLICNITCAGLLTLQFVWFILIVRGVVSFLKTFLSPILLRVQNVLRHRAESVSKDNNPQQDINNTMLLNGKKR